MDYGYKNHYCDRCDRSIIPLKENMTRIVTVRDQKIEVKYTGYICPCCCTEIYDEDVETEVAEKAKTAYKKKMRMIQTSELLSFMKKNRLTAEMVAERIHCNAWEVIQAAHGGIQTVETDQKLKKFMKNKTIA